MMTIGMLLSLFLIYAGTMYFANASPLILHGTIPLDGGKKLFGKRILGDGKTVLGTCGGILVGTAVGALLYFIFPLALAINQYFALIVALSVGAIAGDIIKSFFKRRLGIASGQQWAYADQLDFVIGGLIASTFIRTPELELVLLLLVVTVFAHSLFNFVAFKLKLKKVPW